MEWGSLGLCLDVPSSIRSEIEEKYSTVAQRKQAMLEEWRNHHPAPSWMLVANVLYTGRFGGKLGKYHKLLQVMKGKYLKGEIILHTCPIVFTVKIGVFSSACERLTPWHVAVDAMETLVLNKGSHGNCLECLCWAWDGIWDWG